MRRKIRGCLIRSKKYVNYNDKQYIRSKDNASIIFSRKAERFNVRTRGPMFFKNRRRKNMLLTQKIL